MDDSHVALTKCYYCGGPGDIVLATRYRNGLRGEMQPVVNVKEKCHGKVINMEPCQECKKYMAVGVILMSIQDGEGKKMEEAQRLDPDQMPNPFRTGCFTVMKDEAARRLFTADSIALKYKWCFIEDTLWDRIGLPRRNDDFSHPNEAKGPVGECQVCKTRRQLDTTWSREKDGMTIRARCLTCFPNEGDKEFTLVPHTLKLYEFRGKTESGNGDSKPEP